MDRRNFLRGGTTFAGIMLCSSGFASPDWKTRVDFTASMFNAAAFPARSNWLQSVTCVGTTHWAKAGYRTLMIAELRYGVIGVGGAARMRRCFVVSGYVDNNAPTLKPILLAAFPGSSVTPGGGARDLFDYPAGAPDYEFNWPLVVARDTGVYAVLIDEPRYGFNPYVPTNTYDALIDAVAGIDAAKWFIGSIPLLWYNTLKPYDPNVPPVFNLSPKLMLGGQSYGAMTTQFLAGILPDAYSAYISGGSPAKATFAFAAPPNPPDWYPADWAASGYDFKDMIKASAIKKAMFVFGWDNHGAPGALPSDYARVNPAWATSVVDAPCTDMVAFDPSRFEFDVLTSVPTVQGHEINLPHCKAWHAARVAELVA